MESSEEEDGFPSLESIFPQSKVDSLYQSHTEKGIRKLCCELLHLKNAVENLCGDMRTKYLAFLSSLDSLEDLMSENGKEGINLEVLDTAGVKILELELELGSGTLGDLL